MTFDSAVLATLAKDADSFQTILDYIRKLEARVAELEELILNGGNYAMGWEQERIRARKLQESTP